MQTVAAPLEGVLVLKPEVLGDVRGFLFESYNARKFEAATGVRPHFVQDNHSRSRKGVLRGLHYQVRQPQSKLVWVTAGEVFDVAVDIRMSSPTFGKWYGHVLSAENKLQIWIPTGFAHGFLALSESAELLYKTTDYWAPEHERCIAWNDPDLAIDWPLAGIAPLVSAKDAHGVAFRNAEVFP